MPQSKWITPFMKQCFVTFGVSLNMSSHGVVMGFTSVLLPQLKSPHSTIKIDINSGSWIASATGVTLVLGNVLLPVFMERFGRRNANVMSLVIMIAGWACIITASSVSMLIIGRLLQGLSLGLSASLGSVLIGEYTSPKNRGAFLASIAFAFTVGVLIVHSLGMFLTWTKTALISGSIAFVNLILVLYSPESPSWLIHKKRYSQGTKIFHWLRGNEEEDELRKIIEAKMTEIRSEIIVHKKLILTIKEKIAYFVRTAKKVEFYKPVLIMMHLYALGQWSGANILAAYTEDVYRNIIGNDVNIGLTVIIVDIQRIISNGIAIFVIKKVRRLIVLAVTSGLNIATYFVIAAYCYAKDNNLISFQSSGLGIALIHIHMFSIGTGTVPLPFIIAGELFPLKYKGLAGGVSVLSMSVNMFLTIKTFPFLLASVRLYGAYCVFGCIILYCLIISLILLPETKDRTLKEIEDEIKGIKHDPENNTVNIT